MLHTQFWCLCKEDPLGFTIHHPELIMLKKIKSYRDWSALKKVYHTELKKIIIVFHIKIHEISPGAIQKSNGLKVICLMSSYFKSEEDTMKNEIFLKLYIPTFDEKYLFTECIEKFYKLLNYFCHYAYHCMFFNYTIIIDRKLELIKIKKKIALYIG